MTLKPWKNIWKTCQKPNRIAITDIRWLYAAIAAQKGYNSLYLMSVYGHPQTENWFKAEYKASGKKLHMGKSCVHFKRAEDSHWI